MRFLRRSGCRRRLFLDSLPDSLDRFHSRGTLRSPYTSDANALHGTAKSVDKGDPHPYGRCARGHWCRSRNASGGTSAACHQRCGGFEEGCPKGHFCNSPVHMLLGTSREGRPNPRLRGRQRTSASRRDSQTQDERIRPDRITRLGNFPLPTNRKLTRRGPAISQEFALV